MDDSEVRSTEQRLAELELAVADIKSRLREMAEVLATRAEPLARDPMRRVGEPAVEDRGAAPRPQGSYRRAQSATARRRASPTAGRTAWQGLLNRGPQFWISRLGIGLVLLSVVFLFDYAIDRGWLTPPIRTAIGLALGAALTFVGYRVRRKERWFSQVMLGGASASWYITGFAAFQLLHVVSYPIAFGFMVAVTVFTFWMGIREDGAALGVLGAVGGLGTPFFLYTEQGSLSGLVAYTCLVLLGASGIYLVQGWKSLLWTSVIGGWTVLLLGFSGVTLSERWVVQAGIVAAWLMLWLVPAGRELLAVERPGKWRRPQSRLSDVLRRTGLAADPDADLALLVAAMPVGALFFSRATWESGDALWGFIALALAVCLAGAAAFIRSRPTLGVLASGHSVGAAILAVIAVALLFGPDLQILLWAGMAVAFLYLGRRLDETELGKCGHVLSVIVAVWLLQRLAGGGTAEMAVLTARGLCDAGVIVGFLAASLWSGRNSARWYRLAAHFAFLGWLWRELTLLPAGQAIVTASFGVYGMVLLTAAARTRKVGMATLLIAVGKLFLVDLERVDPFLRILLFLGFGGLFLTISYYYRDRWRAADPEGLPPDSPDPS
jgi:hypothetical protein